MAQQPKRRLDLKKRDAAATAASTDQKVTESPNILRKDITFTIFLPGALGGPISSKLNDDALIRIMIADNKKFQGLPYWKVKRAFYQLSHRQRRNIVKNRKYFPEVGYPEPETFPEDYVPAPYFHIDRPVTVAKKVMNLSEEVVSGFISGNEYPGRFLRKKELWDEMTERQRLIFHLNQIAEGKQYFWRYVEN